MRVFVCILECGSLSAATRELGLTQLAVSNHLHAAVEGVVAAGAGMGVVPTRALDAGSVVSQVRASSHCAKAA